MRLCFAFYLSLVIVVASSMGVFAHARNYVVVVACKFDVTYIFDMDERGILKLREKDSKDFVLSPSIAVSPNNRLIISTSLYGGLRAFFFGKDGASQGYKDSTIGYSIANTVFHATSNNFYTGPADSAGSLAQFSYDIETTSISLITKSKPAIFPINILFSKISNSIIFRTPDPEYFNASLRIQGYKLNECGYFDTLTSSTQLNRDKPTIAGMVYGSPDGKTVLIMSAETPPISVYRTHPNAIAQHVQEYRYGGNSSYVDSTAVFSPDSKYLYIIPGDGQAPPGLYPLAFSYTVDADTSMIQQERVIERYPWIMNDHPSILSRSSSITPDGRFIIVPHWRPSEYEQISRIGVIRVDGPNMTALPIQTDISFPEMPSSSGIAVFNTNATDPGWAAYE